MGDWSATFISHTIDNITKSQTSSTLEFWCDKHFARCLAAFMGFPNDGTLSDFIGVLLHLRRGWEHDAKVLIVGKEAERASSAAAANG